MLQESKKILSLLICVVMLVMLAPQFQLPVVALDFPEEYDIPITRSPETPETVVQGTCGSDIQWTLNAYGRLTLTGGGRMYDYHGYWSSDKDTYISNTPWFQYRQDIQTVIIHSGVTSIGECAFYGCSSLTSVTIPESVTTIGYNAFRNCSSLTDITIPESVTGIGFGAFGNCSSLTGITIPERVIYIGENTFYGCSSLTSITIPEGVTGIGYEAFSGCSGLTGITIPDGVAGIDYGTFYNCSSLTSVTIPESVLSIFDDAFGNCSSLKTVKFMGSAPTISLSCFSGVNATAYHACTDTSWTNSVKESYGGSLTWIGHLFSDYVYNQDATCTQDGTQTRTCPNCGEEETVIAPNTALVHSFGDNGLCTVCGQEAGETLSGSITSFAAGLVTLTLTGNGIEETLTTDTGSYTLTAAPGQYTLTVAQANHVTQRYAVTLESGNMMLDVKIHLIADIDGNGKVNMGDVSKLNSHLKGTNLITDEYMLLCANVNGGSLNMGDTASLYAHIKGTKKLY